MTPNPLSISKFVSYINSGIDTAISTYGLDGGVPNEMLVEANRFRDSLVIAHADWLSENTKCGCKTEPSETPGIYNVTVCAKHV